MSGRDWTTEDERQLVELRVAGKSWLAIAKALRRTQASVQGRWHAKLKPKPGGG
jgi:hypothetical protein